MFGTVILEAVAVYWPYPRLAPCGSQQVRLRRIGQHSTSASNGVYSGAYSAEVPGAPGAAE